MNGICEQALLLTLKVDAVDSAGDDGVRGQKRLLVELIGAATAPLEQHREQLALALAAQAPAASSVALELKVSVAAGDEQQQQAAEADGDAEMPAAEQDPLSSAALAQAARRLHRQLASASAAVADDGSGDEVAADARADDAAADADAEAAAGELTLTGAQLCALVDFALDNERLRALPLLSQPALFAGLVREHTGAAPARSDRLWEWAKKTRLSLGQSSESVSYQHRSAASWTASGWVTAVNRVLDALAHREDPKEKALPASAATNGRVAELFRLCQQRSAGDDAFAAALRLLLPSAGPPAVTAKALVDRARKSLNKLKRAREPKRSLYAAEAFMPPGPPAIAYAGGDDKKPLAAAAVSATETKQALRAAEGRAAAAAESAARTAARRQRHRARQTRSGARPGAVSAAAGPRCSCSGRTPQ